MQSAAQRDVATREKQAHELDYGLTLVTQYLGDGSATSDSPDAVLVEFRPGAGPAIPAHFHKVAQFQVIVGGEGHVGKRPVTPITFHYADPSTTYGPITPADPARGIDFLTLRPVTRRGVYYMPGSRHEMADRAGRMHRNIVASIPRIALPHAGCERVTLIEEDADGLGAFALRLAANATIPSPSAHGTGGQYLIVTQGSVRHVDEELHPFSLLFVDEGDGELELRAGPDGAELLVLRFPQEVIS